MVNTHSQMHPHMCTLTPPHPTQLYSHIHTPHYQPKHAHTHTHIHVYMYTTYMRAHTHTHTYADTPTPTCTHSHTHACTHTYIQPMSMHSPYLSYFFWFDITFIWATQHTWHVPEQKHLFRKWVLKHINKHKLSAWRKNTNVFAVKENRKWAKWGARPAYASFNW